MLATFASLAIGLFGKASSQAEPPQIPIHFVEPSEDALLLLSVRIDGIQLADSLEAYRNGVGVLVPLSEICRLLELDVKVNPTIGSASGSVGRKDHEFDLDMSRTTARFDGKGLIIDPNFFQTQKKDIYIDIRELNAWFAFGITFNDRGSEITIQPKEPLPLQLRLNRERQAAMIRSAASGRRQDPGYPRIPNPYAMIGSPSIDQSLAINVPSANGSTGPPVRYYANVSADVAHTEVNGFLDLEPGVAFGPQFFLGQKDPGEGLLGPLHARDAEIGQLESMNIPLVSGSSPESGIFVSNAPLSYDSSWSQTTISGPLLPGWDVELYLAATLLGYKQEDGSGRYVFQNIPVMVGTTQFRLVFNGPQGQHREEVRTKSLSDSLVLPGSMRYGLFLGESRTTPDNALETEWGITKNLTAFTNLAQEGLLDGSHIYMTAGMRGFVGNTLISERVVQDPKSGQADEIDGQWTWGRTRIDLDETLVSGLVSKVLSPYLNPTKNETVLKLGNLSLPAWANLMPADLQFSRQQTSMGTEVFNASGRLSYQSRGLSITNWSSLQTETNSTEQRQGELLASTWQHQRFMQGSLAYSWNGLPSISALNFRVGSVLRDMRILTFAAYETPLDHNLGITASLSQNTGKYAWSRTIDLSTKHGLGLGLSLSFGAVRNPANGSWLTSAQSQIARGAVLIHVFLDVNGNGKFDPGETSLPGVAVFVNESGYQRLTGKDGTLLVDGLSPHQPVDIRISDSTLENSLWVPKVAGFRIIPRPGSVPRVEIAIVATGEVSGTVYVATDGSPQTAGGILVEIVDAKSRVIQKQRTAYDGYYTFSRIPVGTYTLRAANELLGSNRPVNIPPAGAYLDGIDLTLAKTKT